MNDQSDAQPPPEEAPPRGALTLTLLFGLVIVASWLAIFFIYLSRG